MTSAEAAVRYEIDKFERKIARHKDEVSQRQATLRAIKTLQVLARISTSGNSLQAEPMRTLSLFPYSFTDDSLRDDLAKLDRLLIVYLAIPDSATTKAQTWNEIREAIQSVHVSVEEECDYAVTQLAAQEKEGRKSLNDDIAHIREAAST